MRPGSTTISCLVFISFPISRISPAIVPMSAAGRYTAREPRDRLASVTVPMALPAPYQQMASADELLDRPDELQAAYERDGYLFFRSVLDRAEVDRAAGKLLEAMRAEDLVDPPPDGSRPARWSGRPLDAIDDRGFYEVPYYPDLLDTATTQRFLLRVFGEPVFTFRSLTVRYALPADDRHISLPHQDHFFIRHTAAFRTLWVPLLPIEPAGGALAVSCRLASRRAAPATRRPTCSPTCSRGAGNAGYPWPTSRSPGTPPPTGRATR